MFMSKGVNLTGLLGDIKEDCGSEGWKSPSGVQRWSPGRGSGGHVKIDDMLILEENIKGTRGHVSKP